MSMNAKDLKTVLKDNSYPGRGFIVGKSADGSKGMLAYFIMGRSENSRNRVFAAYGGEIRTEPFDVSKLQDPSLILYSPVKTVGRKVIVTNGDQTDAIAEALKNGRCLRHALRTRRFEPDAPNFTPRISAVLHLGTRAEDFSYEMAILKCTDGKGERCARYFFEYEAENGVGRFLHTYQGDGDPLPAFEGEPEAVKIGNELPAFSEEIWESLDAENKISLVCRAYDLQTGESTQMIFNKNKR